MTRIFVFLLCAFIANATVWADRPLKLIDDPNLSPDGKTILFEHGGDIWKVSSAGGRAERLTANPASESQPRYSPDGNQIAFVSDRSGSRQVYVLTEGNSTPKQVTFHTEGYSLHDWFPDGRHLLVSGNRDHFWRNAQRLFKIDTEQPGVEKLIFNEGIRDAKCSPDGSKILFSFGGEPWWRKGYRGARSTQIWLYDLNLQIFSECLKQDTESFTPVWKPDKSGFYYCGSQNAANGARNLWEFDLASEESKQLTFFEDDLVHQPAVSADGKTIVFSHLFDLYRLDLMAEGKPTPQRIEVTVSNEEQSEDLFRRRLTEATDATATSDGLEIAFISGGDLWVMETVLREPVRITTTAEFETDPVFVDEDNAILCVGWKDGQADIMKVTRADESRYWWQNSEFHFSWLTDDQAIESDLQLSPDKKKLAFTRPTGELWVMDLASGEKQRVFEGFSISGFDFSPDCKWMVYATQDNDFNSDIWIASLDGTTEPVNITRHPAGESQPKWSSDGSIIAFTGRRNSREEVDIYYVYLKNEDHDTGKRDRDLKKTLEAFKKAREKSKSPDKPDQPEKEKSDQAAKPEADKDNAAENKDAEPKSEDKPKADDKKKPADEKKKAPPEVKIDFDQIHRRIHHISIPNSSESLLAWAPTGKKLFFTGSQEGRRGTFSIEFPDELTPKRVSSDAGRWKSWVSGPERIFWLVDSVPGLQPVGGGSTEKFTFTALQPISLAERNGAAFLTAWRTMRDRWYDENLGNQNWDAIRRKYIDVVQSSGDTGTLTKVVQLMLGELNGSHLGFTPRRPLDRAPSESDPQWRPVTGHLGARFDETFLGPGWKIKDVIPNSPAADLDSLLQAGEIILSIDGQSVDPGVSPAQVLTGAPDRDVRLLVKGIDDEKTERTVVIRPTSYGRIRTLLYQKWQDDNRETVNRLAKEYNIGYVHIAGMNQPSFMDFQRELYEIGFGKDGLIIDVRDNGGGSTADHLLTALTQPRHSITVPRGGGQGYPGDRLIYTSWHKPIVVLCNQNSYSNAEIFSHAVKILKRGKLVGVPTAGGVISTGSAQIMDVGTVRMPFRGWYLTTDGQDLELNGAVPDIIVWPKPTELPNGVDRQLNRAVKAMKTSIDKWKAQETPPLIKATDRKPSDYPLHREAK